MKRSLIVPSPKPSPASPVCCADSGSLSDHASSFVGSPYDRMRAMTPLPQGSMSPLQPGSMTPLQPGSMTPLPGPMIPLQPGSMTPRLPGSMTPLQPGSRRISMPEVRADRNIQSPRLDGRTHSSLGQAGPEGHYGGLVTQSSSTLSLVSDIDILEISRIVDDIVYQGTGVCGVGRSLVGVCQLALVSRA